MSAAHPRGGARRRRPPDRRPPAHQGHAPGPRKRGGQPANLNALKHGLYARTLTPAALVALEIARGLKAHALDEEIATLRAKLSDLPTRDRQTFMAGLALLVRAVHVNYRISPKATEDLAQSLQDTLNRLGDQLLPPGD